MLNKLSQIDQLTVGDHYHLSITDDVWYFGEYSSGQRYDYSPANQLIANLKHGVEHRGTPRWQHKVAAINKVGHALSQRISATAQTDFTFVPIPPSVIRTDPSYDSRTLDILNAFKARTMGAANVRELLYQSESTRRSHLSNTRVTQQELINVYRINEAVATPPPQTVVLFDDVLTTGTHFLAARHVITQRFPGVRVIGLVVCRRKLPNPADAFDMIPD